jgi:hypothetical protein
MLITLLVATLASAGTLVSSAAARGAADAAAGSPSTTVWLCEPGIAHDPCTSDRSAALVSAGGHTRIQNPVGGQHQPIDCFYVYPTVSSQPTVNADLHIDRAEINVAKAQASRFSQVCRVYAPMYRQLTLRAIGGGIDAQAAATAYLDVQRAWRDYLAHDNHGRGVVLIGHSQGAGMLTTLVQHEIDANPSARRRIVAAYLLGGNVVVPEGKDVGGDFEHVPACRSRAQTGCVVAFSTFDQPPPANSLFGRVGGGRLANARADAASSRILCVNPAALRGGAADVRAYFPTHLNLGALGTSLPADALAKVKQPWVAYPGLFRARCEDEGGASWLQVDEQRTARDVRPHLVDSLGPTWGLHLIDANIAAGDLVSLAAAQGQAWVRDHRA